MNFASDNNAGVHPEVLQAINSCDEGYACAYGDDKWTIRAQEICKEIFGSKSSLFHVFGGTPANILAIEPLIDRFGAILCSDEAHIWRDEAGAPERILSNKLYSVPALKGKISPESIDATMKQFEDAHQPIPQVLSITQTTEFGNVYSIEHLQEIGESAKKHNLKIHIDGARYCNAAVALDCSLADIVNACGASSLSLGMTKNGGMFGENIVFFNDEHAKHFEFRRRSLMQVQSKMRYVSTQFIAFFEDDLWKRSAGHANDMATLLAEKVSGLESVKMTSPVETNAVFAEIPKDMVNELLKTAFFYVFRPKTNEVRWMTSWQTTEIEVNNFANKIQSLS